MNYYKGYGSRSRYYYPNYPEPQGAYNPYMKYPDWGAAIRDILSGMEEGQEWKARKAELEQQKKERLKQEEAELEQKSKERWAREKFPKEYEEYETGQMLPGFKFPKELPSLVTDEFKERVKIDTGINFDSLTETQKFEVVMTMFRMDLEKQKAESKKKTWAKPLIEQIKKATPGLTDEDISQMSDDQIQDLLDYAQGRKPEGPDPQIAADKELIDSAIKRYGDEINKTRQEVQKVGTLGEKGAAEELRKLGIVLDYLYSLKAFISDTELPERQRKRVNEILGSMGRIKKEGIGILDKKIEMPIDEIQPPTKGISALPPGLTEKDIAEIIAEGKKRNKILTREDAINLYLSRQRK